MYIRGEMKMNTDWAGLLTIVGVIPLIGLLAVVGLLAVRKNRTLLQSLP